MSGMIDRFNKTNA